MSNGRLSVDECLEYLCNGYMRLEADHWNLSLPHDLLCLMVQFMKTIFFKFDEGLTDTESMQMVNDVMIRLIHPNPNYKYGGSALIDLAIPVHDRHCSLKWKIRIIAKCFPNYHYFIGVSSNNCTNFVCSAHANLTDSYGILGKHTGIAVDGHSKNDKEYQRVFGSGDTVCVEYDGCTQQLTFSDCEAKKKMYVMRLPANRGIRFISSRERVS